MSTIRTDEERLEFIASVVDDYDTPYRPLESGMGQAVAERTILRRHKNGDLENWGDVADRVALGNSLLTPSTIDTTSPVFSRYSQKNEHKILKHHISKGIMLMSGRHLQHGDKDQPTRNQEVFTNCATAASSFALFYLLLNGSGVGRCYDDDMMLVNWDNAPNMICVLDEAHKDFDYVAHTSVRDAKHLYGTGKEILWHEVADSREGWAKALEIWESAAFEKIHNNKLLILDFSKVRCKGSPIGGMQDRPSSGPVPLMNAFQKAAKLKGAGLEPWLQSMYVDHYFAECVLVGGARRAARMSTKWWKDSNIFEFIQVKRPIEYEDMSAEEVADYRKRLAKSKLMAPNGFLWSSNNSVAVDQEYWDLLATKKGTKEYMEADAVHARRVHRMLTACSYGDGTGEPGVLNLHHMKQDDTGIKKLSSGEWLGSDRYQINEETQVFLSRLAKRAMKKKWHMIVNPCAEIILLLLGGFCVIGDVAPFHATSLEEAEDGVRAMVRALMRTNLMRSIYGQEVERTNRIGVGLTGVHEFAWKFFGYDFNDLIDEEKSKDFWLTLSRFNRAARDEAESYAKILGVNVPHTVLTVKPAGTTSKLFGLTEGWHLPSMTFFLRNVQFRSDDPLVEKYMKLGYPTRKLKDYDGTTIVGFPTSPTLSKIMPADRIVTASDASMEQQYQWLLLGEKYWIRGTDEEGNPVSADRGNNISYTMKYKPENVDLAKFREVFGNHQSRVKCCSVMPHVAPEDLPFEYVPEETITKIDYEKMVRKIQRSISEGNEVISEDIDKTHIDCDGGACPVDFKSTKV